MNSIEFNYPNDWYIEGWVTNTTMEDKNARM
jgi:hypothetical protein